MPWWHLVRSPKFPCRALFLPTPFCVLCPFLGQFCVGNEQEIRRHAGDNEKIQDGAMWGVPQPKRGPQFGGGSKAGRPSWVWLKKLA